MCFRRGLREENTANALSEGPLRNNGVKRKISTGSGEVAEKQIECVELQPLTTILRHGGNIWYPSIQKKNVTPGSKTNSSRDNKLTICLQTTIQLVGDCSQGYTREILLSWPNPIGHAHIQGIFLLEDKHSEGISATHQQAETSD